MVCLHLCFYLIFLPFPHIHLLCFLNSTYEWDDRIFVFLWLISLSIIHSSSIHLQVARFHSFCLPSNIPFYTRVHTHTYTHTIFFIHSSFDGHLGSFHTLAVVDGAAINIGVHVPVRICFLLVTSELFSLFPSLPFKYVCLFIFNIYSETPCVHVGEGQREWEQVPLAVWSLTRGSILWSWNHDLSQNQESEAQLTELPRRPVSSVF